MGPSENIDELTKERQYGGDLFCSKRGPQAHLLGPVGVEQGVHSQWLDDSCFPLCGRLSLEHSLLFNKRLTVWSVKFVIGSSCLLVSVDVDMSSRS